MPDWVSTAATAVSVLVLLVLYVSWRASRLDRLHTRVETARAALDAALVRRGAVVLELASAPELEPASAMLLADAAVRARRAAALPSEGGRELVESNLSRALRAVVEEPGFRVAIAASADGSDAATRGELLAEIEAAAKRVHLARRFHNDAVASIREVRASRLVRTLRLAGRAPVPEFFEMDDQPPAFDVPA